MRTSHDSTYSDFDYSDCNTYLDSLPILFRVKFKGKIVWEGENGQSAQWAADGYDHESYSEGSRARAAIYYHDGKRWNKE